MQGNDSSCGMTTAFNMSSSNTSISLAKKTKIYTFHFVILSQTHTCKTIISSYPHNPSSRPFTQQSCPNISFLLAYFFRLFHLLFYWPCANTIKNFGSEEETVMNWPRSQQTDSVKSSEKIPRLSVSKIIRSKWQMADVRLQTAFVPLN